MRSFGRVARNAASARNGRAGGGWKKGWVMFMAGTCVEPRPIFHECACHRHPSHTLWRNDHIAMRWCLWITRVLTIKTLRHRNWRVLNAHFYAWHLKPKAAACEVWANTRWIRKRAIPHTLRDRDSFGYNDYHTQSKRKSVKWQIFPLLKRRQ